MTIHVNTVRSAVNSILEGSTEGDLETAKVKKTIETYGSKMPKEKLALYKSLLQLKESKRMKSLKALHWLSNEPEEPKELRSKVFGATKQKKIAWHRMSYWLFALTVKQLRQVAAVVRGEVPAEVRNGRKVQIVFYIVKGAVEGADRPAKLGEVYANTLEVSQWDGLPDKESVEYQKAHDQKKAKAKKRRRKRREKKQPSKKELKEEVEEAEAAPAEGFAGCFLGAGRCPEHDPGDCRRHRSRRRPDEGDCQRGAAKRRLEGVHPRSSGSAGRREDG